MPVSSTRRARSAGVGRTAIAVRQDRGMAPTDVRTAAPALGAVPPADPATQPTPLDTGNSPTTARQAAGLLARELGPGAHTVDVAGLDAPMLRAVAEGLVLGSYRFSRATEAP